MESLKKYFLQIAVFTVNSLVLSSFFIADFAIAVEQREPAQSMQLEEITVTAQKTESSKQDVPANITVFDSMALDERQVDSLVDLSAITPNLGFDLGDNRGTYLNYRGIGGMTNMNKIFTVNIDGVTVPYVALDTFLDVERVEVLRGSQGTLYGRNAYAGVVNIITRKPQESGDGSMLVEYGSYNKTSFQTTFGDSITENTGYRLALAYDRNDGYFENDYLGIDDGNEQEQFTGHGKFVVDISDDNRLTFGLLVDKYDDGFDAYSPDGSYHTINNETGYNDGHLISPTLTWEKVFDNFTLTSISNYSRSNYGFLQDWDFSMADATTAEYDEIYNTVTEELRLNGEVASGLKWLAGLFLMNESVDMETTVNMGVDTGDSAGMKMGQNSTIDNNNAALFGRLTYRILPQIEVSGGLRLDYSKKDLYWQNFSNVGMPVVKKDYDNDWFAFLPSASISYLPVEEQRIYLSVTRGYKEGDYNSVQFDPATVTDAVDPEYTMTYETGYKGIFADRRLELNLAAFYIDWSDMQVDTVLPDSTGAFNLIKQNAADSHSSGMEIGVRGRLVKGFTAFLNAGYLFEYEFDDFAGSASGNLSGNNLPRTHEYTLSTGVVYHHPGGLFISAEANLQGPKYFSEKNTFKQKEYTLVNAKIGYEADNWSVSLYGRNLLDEEYINSTFGPAKKAGEPLFCGIQGRFYF